MTTVFVSDKNVTRALNFAQTINAANQQSGKDFGRADLQRTSQDKTADTLQGKIAEIAVADFFENKYGFTFTPDFEIYPGQQNTDNGNDISTIFMDGKNQPCTFSLDIKATRDYSKWFLLEKHKYDFGTKAFILCKVYLPRNIEKTMADFQLEPVKCEIAGLIYREELQLVDGDFWFSFRRGDRLQKFRPSRKPSCTNRTELNDWLKVNRLEDFGPPLKAMLNYGMPINWLNNSTDSWLKLKEKIQAGLS